MRIKKLKIKASYWYYLDLRNPRFPKLIRDYFQFQSEYENCMEKFLINKKRYFLITGKELLKYKGDYEVVKTPYPSARVLDWAKVPMVNSDSDFQRMKLSARRIKMEKARKEGVYPFSTKACKTWEYPEGCITSRQKKTFRELERRKYWRPLKSIY
jgi:hypothetical protein